MVDAVGSASTTGKPAVVKVTDTDGNKSNAMAVALIGTDGNVVGASQTNAEFLAALRSTGTHSSVASGTASVTILAANANRKGARIFNTDANNLFLDLSGGTAVAASRAQVVLAQNVGYDVPFGLTGAITGIWSADGAGVASVVEFA